jgi:hypothetical protein
VSRDLFVRLVRALHKIANHSPHSNVSTTVRADDVKEIATISHARV